MAGYFARSDRRRSQTVHAWQRQIEQYQVKIGVPLYRLERKLRLTRFEHCCIRNETDQYTAERIPDQCVIIDDQNLHMLYRAIVATPTSFDDTAGAHADRLRHFEANLARSLQIDVQIESCRLLKWQLGGTGAFEDSVNRASDFLPLLV